MLFWPLRFSIFVLSSTVFQPHEYLYSISVCVGVIPAAIIVGWIPDEQKANFSHFSRDLSEIVGARRVRRDVAGVVR